MGRVNGKSILVSIRVGPPSQLRLLSILDSLAKPH